MTAAAVHDVGARIAAIQARVGHAMGVVGGQSFQTVLADTVRTQQSRVHSDTPRVHSDTPRVQFASYMSRTAPGRAGSAPAGEWAQRLPAAGRPWAGQIEAAARQAGVDPKLFAALVWAESGFRPDARSHAGAVGLAQLMPATAGGLGVDPHDPAQNLLGGARYLRAQLDRFGSPELALAAYNAGPGRVAQAGGVPRIAETEAYVPRVLGHYRQLGGTA